MKNRYKSTFAWLGAMLLLVACTPDNPELGNIIPQSELNFQSLRILKKTISFI